MGGDGAAERRRDPNLCSSLARLAANITEICSAAQPVALSLGLSVSPAGLFGTRFGLNARLSFSLWAFGKIKKGHVRLI